MNAVAFLLRVVINALALGAAAWLLDGISVGGDSNEQLWTLLAVGLVFGVVNTFITPVVKLLSIPFIIVTLGLFLIVVNALMLLLTEEIADLFGLRFTVDGFWTAVLGSIIISIVSAVLGAFSND
jgi:putative membrane protein